MTSKILKNMGVIILLKIKLSQAKIFFVDGQLLTILLQVFPSKSIIVMVAAPPPIIAIKS